MKYLKVTEEDVYRKMVSLAMDVMNPIGGAVSVRELSSMLKTSRYQTKKHIDALKNKEFVELRMFLLYSDDDYFPPYWGYLLTDKGRRTEYYLSKQKKTLKLMEECFG